MEVRLDMFLIILGAALVTFLPRVLPLMVLSRFEIPEWGMRWLRYVPISVMAALIAQELMAPGEDGFGRDNLISILAAVPAVLIAVWKRSLLGTVVAGIVAVMILRFLL